MARPSDYKYAETHEWVKVDGDTATIGLTDFAIKQLNDLTFVDLPDAGDSVDTGASFGEIESVKAVSDLYSPIGGEVVEVNDSVDDDDFKALKEDAFGAGWLVKIKVSDDSGLAKLMDLGAYEKQLASEEE